MLLDWGEAEVAPGITWLSTPGHTPGPLLLCGLCHRGRMLLLGDALDRPVELSQVDWETASDVDSALARWTREVLLT